MNFVISTIHRQEVYQIHFKAPFKGEGFNPLKMEQ